MPEVSIASAVDHCLEERFRDFVKEARDEAERAESVLAFFVCPRVVSQRDARFDDLPDELER